MEEKALDNLRHSCAHLLAAAVEALYPGVKRTIGPAIENGFYYDFDFGDKKVSETDFVRIEQKMHELSKTWPSFERHEVTRDQSLREFADNPYKKELIEEFSSHNQPLTIYQSGEFRDLCRGGHVDDPKYELKHFKLLSIAGAYWRGDEKNKMLTRIYGTCFPTKEALDQFLVQQEEAKKRDHRKLGADLDLFVFSDLVGKGLPLWTAKGAVIRRQLERFIVDEEIRRGYQHVYTPDIAQLALYKTSGHYPYYKDTMYPPLAIDDEQFMLRPMTCPHHFELYRSKPRSYRELPMRIAELAKLYRYEKSGELTGLMRVRTFCLADAHIIAKKEQATGVICEVLDLIEYTAKVFGLAAGKNYRYRLALGNRTDEKKYYTDDAAWDYAENVLRSVLQKRHAQYYEIPNEAAFYGPKIDIQMKNIWGKEETAFTVQYDFVMPKRFTLEFIDETGAKQEPIVIHRSSIGAIERTVAFLIEQYGGKFPLWLSPVQVALIPIADRHVSWARAIADTLKKSKIRTELDDRSESMQAKIRQATLQKIPYMGIIGDKEMKNGSGGTVTIRTRDGKNLGTLTPEEFLHHLQQEIEHSF